MEYLNIILRRNNKIDAYQSDKNIKKQTDDYINKITKRKNKLKLIGEIQPNNPYTNPLQQQPLPYSFNIPNVDLGDNNLYEDDDTKKHFDNQISFYNKLIDNEKIKLNYPNIDQNEINDINNLINLYQNKINEINNTRQHFINVIKGHKIKHNTSSKTKDDLEKQLNDLNQILISHKELNKKQKNDYEDQIIKIKEQLNKNDLFNNE